MWKRASEKGEWKEKRGNGNDKCDKCLFWILYNLEKAVIEEWTDGKVVKENNKRKI